VSLECGIKVKEEIILMKKGALQKIYGTEVSEKIETSNILIIGAGGIGCELIKALSLSGFKNLTVVRNFDYTN
jgi:molybdopterin/thiamine biosynthesis adenylyltransferase